MQRRLGAARWSSSSSGACKERRSGVKEPVIARHQSETYYVVEPVMGWWAHFTITPEIGLLQVHSDFGNYAARWSGGAVSDFKGFLIQKPPYHIGAYLDDTAEPSESLETVAVQKKIQLLVTHLWPLFAQALADERIKTDERYPDVMSTSCVEHSDGFREYYKARTKARTKAKANVKAKRDDS
jgi:hypothetical protein